MLASLWTPARAHAEPEGDPRIQFELRPRICTLAATDKQCETRVSAHWLSDREESLCLVILDRPEVKRCWEHYTEGIYSIELEFAEDLVFQMRDPELRQVLASETLRVIREALRLRHKRRQPWNVFD
jgi:hypothetical protein